MSKLANLERRQSTATAEAAAAAVTEAETVSRRLPVSKMTPKCDSTEAIERQPSPFHFAS